jgi:transposase
LIWANDWKPVAMQPPNLRSRAWAPFSPSIRRSASSSSTWNQMRRSVLGSRDSHCSASGAQKRGERFQAIGRSRGERTTKIHILVDEHGRPHVLHLTADQASDIVAAADLIAQSRPSARLLADRAYDGDALRHSLAERGTRAVIPNKVNRVNRFPFDVAAYKLRNAVERAFCRLKDFRAIATRYDKLARNFLAGICLAAALSFWIK